MALYHSQRRRHVINEKITHWSLLLGTSGFPICPRTLNIASPMSSLLSVLPMCEGVSIKLHLWQSLFCTDLFMTNHPTRLTDLSHAPVTGFMVLQSIFEALIAGEGGGWGGWYLFTYSPEINWLVLLFPQNRKFVFLRFLFPNIIFVPVPSIFGLCSPVLWDKSRFPSSPKPLRGPHLDVCGATHQGNQSSSQWLGNTKIHLHCYRD